MKTRWIYSQKPTHLVDKMESGEYFHLSISQEMVEAECPVAVPDDDFMAGKIREGIIQEYPEPKQAQEKVDAFESKRKAEQKAVDSVTPIKEVREITEAVAETVRKTVTAQKRRSPKRDTPIKEDAE
jgi:hypothetical protein